MGWPCKLCSAVVPAKTDILKHYRLHHGTFGHSHAFPCIHIDCPCSFKNWSSFRCHLSRQHPAVDSLNSPQVTIFFTCLLCQKSGFPSEKEFFEHIGHHLKNNETVKCVFAGFCNERGAGTLRSKCSFIHKHKRSSDRQSSVTITGVT